MPDDFPELTREAHDFSVPHQQHSIHPITHRPSTGLHPMGNDAHVCRRSKFPRIPPDRAGEFTQVVTRTGSSHQGSSRK